MFETLLIDLQNNFYIRPPDSGSFVLRGNIPPRGYIRSPDNGSLVLRGNIPVGHIRQDTVSTDIPPRGSIPPMGDKSEPQQVLTFYHRAG